LAVKFLSCKKKETPALKGETPGLITPLGLGETVWLFPLREVSGMGAIAALIGFEDSVP